ncbi:MAG: tetratricopeptide repeat protein [Porticoccaceae bacterium]
MFRFITTTALFSLVFMMPVMVSTVAPYSDFSASAFAEEKEKEEPKFKNVKTRKRQSVGAKCGKALEKIQVVLEEEDWPKSMEMLEGIEASSKTCKSPYELTQVWKFKGYVYYSLDDFPGAIRSYKQVINGEGTPEDLRLDTRYTLAQLFTAEERYADAAEQLEIWIDESTIVSNDARGLLAQIYYQLDRKEESLNMLELAIADVESKGKLPKERWWSLQRVLYYEKNDYDRVIAILEKLVKHYPKWTFWKQLGGMYGEQERPLDQLVASEVVYMNGKFDKESQVMGVGYMYLSAEVPYKAGKIISQGIEDGIIESNAKNLEVLGTAWYQAKELNLALQALDAASQYSDSGDLQSRMAGIYLDLGKDSEAYKASLKAAKKGNVKRASSNYLIMGNALVNMHCYKDAIAAFQKALKAAETKKEKKFPTQWIRYADVEGERLDKLRKLGAEVPSCRK